MLTRTVKVTRHRYLPKDGGGTIMFKVHIGRLGLFLDPPQVPEFDGEEAWFEVVTTGQSITFVRRAADQPKTRR